jgi:hypothetical protein
MIPQDFNKGFEIRFWRLTPAAPTTKPVSGADRITAAARNWAHAKDPHIQYTGI